MKLAIFDFDGTLFPIQTIPFLIKQYPKLGYSRRRQWLVYVKMIPHLFKYKVLKSIDKESFRGDALVVFLELFNGMTETQVTTYFSASVETVYDLLDKKIVEEAIRLKAEGYHTVLLSGCFDMLLTPLGEKIGFDEVIATHLLFELEKGEEPLFSSKTPVRVISGAHKANAARSLDLAEPISWEDSVAYADSYYDRDILELVGHKIGVNPDKKLHEICTREGWQILLT